MKAIRNFRMSNKRTSSEVQARIQQRYEDTALLIYRHQHANKQDNLSRNESSPQARRAFENIDQLQELHVRPAATQGHTQSQICVII